MSYRMLFPEPFLPIVLIALLVSGISMWVINLFSSNSQKIKDIHTRFALSQITERLDGFEESSFPRTSTELFTSLSASNIDWNSCRIEGEQILDGWGQPIVATFDISVGKWTFRSPGNDAEIGTEDDIENATKLNRNKQANKSEPATPRKPSD